MEVIESNKGGAKLCFEGHMYTRKRVQPRRIEWRCVRRTRGCRGTLSTDLAMDARPNQDHDHDGDVEKIEVTKVQNALKRRATETRDKPAQIVAEVIAQCTEEVKARLPINESSKRTIRNQRPNPPNPANIESLGEVPQALQITKTDQPFLMYDNGPNRQNRILVFASDQSVRELARAERWYMDGNFSMAPNIFCRLRYPNSVCCIYFNSSVRAPP